MAIGVPVVAPVGKNCICHMLPQSLTAVFMFGHYRASLPSSSILQLPNENYPDAKFPPWYRLVIPGELRCENIGVFDEYFSGFLL